MDIFFVISGYVITGLLMRQWIRDGRISLGSFYLRRFKRLFPALALMVSVTVLASIVLLPPLGDENRVLYTGIGALAFGANIVVAVLSGDYFAVDAQSNPLLHTWSLSVEEQFYFLFPFLLIAGLIGVGKWLGQRRGAITLIAVFSALSFGLAVLGTRVQLPYGEEFLGFYSPLTRAWEFGVGALIALATPVLGAIGKSWSRIILWAGVVLLTLSLVLISETTPFPGIWTLLPVIGTGLVLIAGAGTDSHTESSVLTSKVMVRIGDWSYSLYLWHWPFIVFAVLAWPTSTIAPIMAAALSVIPALASYFFVERPLREREFRGRSATLGFVISVVTIPLVILGSTWWGVSKFLTPYLEGIVGKPIRESPAVDEQCLKERGFDEAWVASCTWNSGANGEPVYLIGDSNAAHFDVAVIEAGRQTGRPITILTSDSCEPIKDFRLLRPEGDDLFVHCPTYREFVYQFLANTTPGTVILSFADIASWPEDKLYSWAGSTPVSKKEDKQSLLSKALQASIQELQGSGHRVVVVQAVPTFRIGGPTFNPQECNLFKLVSDTCAVPYPLDVIVEVQEPNRLAIEDAAEATGATVLNFRDRFCDGAFCSPSRGGKLMYYDDIHISVEAAEELTGDFAKVLTQP